MVLMSDDMRAQQAARDATAALLATPEGRRTVLADRTPEVLDPEPLPEPEPEPEDLERSWRAKDLGPVLSGDYHPPRPTVGHRSDGVALFYAGRTHFVISETEAGKTWLWAVAACDEMDEGNDVVLVDFEDDEGGIVGRLLALGCEPDLILKRFHYIQPAVPLGTGLHMDDLRESLTTCPTLVGLDGITAAMELHGFDPLSNRDFAAFHRRVATPMTSTGAAVVMLDHVTKSSEGRGRYPIGAAHKLNGVTGASYLLENKVPFGIGRSGRSLVKVAKDRPGQVRRFGVMGRDTLTWFADLVIEGHAEDFVEADINPPDSAGQDAGAPDQVKAAVAAALATGPQSQRQLLLAVKGSRTETKRTALRELILGGFVTHETPHALIKPFQVEPTP